VGVAQRETNFLQPTQQHILGGAHAEKFRAARPKGPVAHHDPVSQFPQVQRPAQMFRQDLFEPDHDPGMMAPGVAPGPAAGGRQTGDQRLDQTPVPWPARPRNATRSWTLSRRCDRFARAGASSAPQYAGRAAELAPPVAKRKALRRVPSHNVRAAPGPSRSRSRRSVPALTDVAIPRGCET